MAISSALSRYLARYSSLSTSSSPDRAASNGNPPKSLSKCCPNLADVLSSRRLRLLVIPTVLILLVLASFGLPTPRLPTGWSRSPGSGQAPVTVVDAAAGFPGGVDWSRFAYTQYVTNNDYLCNSVMVFERLHHLGSRADRVMMYPSYMLDPDAATSGTSLSNDARLLFKARDEYNARLVPINVQQRAGEDKTWAESFTKLLAFNQTQYDRVLSLDSDGTILQPMDELFLLPPCPVALPRAYWLYPEKKILSSHIMLIQPSEAEFTRVMDKVNEAAHNDYDMEIINYLYQDNTLVLPHRRYGMLTAEFRREPGEHVKYLGSDREVWDPVAILNEAKYVHFSDWPVPKPWLRMSDKVRRDNQPKCRTIDGVESCAERDIWNGFYDEFAERRKRVCALEPDSGHKSRRMR